MTLHVVGLRADHDLSGFRCGNSALDRWLRESAWAANAQVTRTYLLVGTDDDGDPDRRVVGYFSIAPHLVERTDLPSRIGRGGPRQVPAVLLAKLALSASVHGEGLGAELLIAALSTILDAARSAGGKLVVVDASDDAAAAFYRHHDFVALPENPGRLIMKLSTVAKALGKPWP